MPCNHSSRLLQAKRPPRPRPPPLESPPPIADSPPPDAAPGIRYPYDVWKSAVLGGVLGAIFLAEVIVLTLWVWRSRVKHYEEELQLELMYNEKKAADSHLLDIKGKATGVTGAGHPAAGTTAGSYIALLQKE